MRPVVPLKIRSPERDFGEGRWKIGIVERLVKALSSQRIGPLA
jgi:hypothetical protein